MALEELELKANMLGTESLNHTQRIQTFGILTTASKLNIDDADMLEISSAIFCDLARIRNKVVIDRDIANFIVDEMTGTDGEGKLPEKQPETWQDRFKREYEELVSRERKLNALTSKYAHGSLDFKPMCSLALLRKQLQAMDAYREVLEERAEIEEIDLSNIRESRDYGEVKG